MNASPLVPDDLQKAIEPLLSKEPPKPTGGRPRVPNRAALAGIIFVLRTGCPWRLLPKELGSGSGVTCWRRLRDWQEAGVWEKLHTRLLNWLGDEAVLDWSRASVDSLSVRAKRGASGPGRTLPTAASPDPSTTSWWIGPVFRWRCVFRPLAPMMRRSSSRCSMPSHPSSALEDDRAVLGSVRPNSTPTRPMTPHTSGGRTGHAVSRLGLRVGAGSPASGWDGTAGWSSAPSPGCSAVAASASATTAVPTCFSDCSTWPLR
jgi:transposase